MTRTAPIGALLTILFATVQAGCAPDETDPFVRDCSEARNDYFEHATAVPAAEGYAQAGIELCQNDIDFYEIQVEPGNLVYVEIAFDGNDTDLMLDVYDTNQVRINQADGGLSYERIAVLPPAGSDPAVYVFRVAGYQGSTGEYGLNIRSFPYEEGMDCDGGDCKRIMQFPAPHDEDPYRFDTWAEYQNARRELIMLVRYALAKTYERYPTQKPLGLIDMSERDGSTPGTAYNSLRHPNGTHIEGNDMDIAYFQTGPDNRARVVCANDGAFCTSETNTMNAEVQAYFMAQLFSSSNVRVIGVDVTLDDDLYDAAQALYAAGAISSAQRQKFASKVSSGSGWPYHHHHIHLSLNWDEGYELNGGHGPLDPYPALTQDR